LKGSVGGKRVAAGTHDYVSRSCRFPESLRGLLQRIEGGGLSSVFVAVEGRFAGVLLLADQIRLDTPRALRLLRQAGIRRIVMLTGDRRELAEAIGTVLGVDEVFAQQDPAHKLAVIAEARKQGTTIMVGDGVNDAPALAAADVGVAMGARGAAASAEAAGVVLLVDRLDRLAEALHITRHARRIAVQSATLGMGLSILAMGVAAAGYLPPLLGAVLQEVIDVAVIVNALRALRARTLRATRYSLSPGQSESLRAEHEQLSPVLDQLSFLADQLSVLAPAEAKVRLEELNTLIRERLVPHEHRDDVSIYPEVAKLLGGDDPLAAMSRAHQEIFQLQRRLDAVLAQARGGALDAAAAREAQRTLYGLDAILRLHFAQEEEIYHGLAQG
ncbi:MAG TPA: heavy metal translocating P-type ATPase, partial [Gammaproteobacteria bacterium]|nr:heavy metal translocating P-type ATPase [Gammaproteobacteria bacterium]